MLTITNPVSWFEIYVEDMSRASTFYEGVFGVKLTNMDDPTGQTKMRNFAMEPGGEGAAGALVEMEGYGPSSSGTIVYFAVEDCAVEEAKVTEAGGEIIKSKQSVGEYGFICLFKDSEGNIVGLHSEK